ncbi:acyl-[acyl-carrier-protein]--UDP-N-acetylglucosamine O-acyltransferase [Crenobacter luteus]|uniref:acyl-ACP--UDP-N-acetylglucosamine O-acyltransferase n=1 Tax=Crenobacter luteus TaxID=1452487 RepID=UPI0010486DD5|nr:acyl-ACP--UDP-N-acetylglucosamine O-acyltransferase [Crenobacter luteus]TCP12151.1 acyl-[acyl-carrier-protein]--UDP-N-acetylglucosamine O-acyltransferase [Crenobacter luteus]
MAIHPTAIVDPKARIASDVEIGAYSIVGPNVSIDSGTWIGPHVVIEGHTSIGKNNRVFQFCSLGAAPQDKKYAGEPTRLEIGDNNTIREFCTFNVGTAQDVGVTRLGNDNWVMAYVHMAHDCQVGNHTIFANNATLAGHVHVGDWVILGGFTSVHQFTVIGDHAMTAFSSAVAQDVPPFVMAAGNRAKPAGINAEGLKRRGFSPEAIRAVKNAYKAIYRQGLSYEDARARIEDEATRVPELAPFTRFFALSERGIIR